MTDIAPFALKPLRQDAPFQTEPRVVLKEWTDWNGHMNVGYYVLAFDQATGDLFDHLGLPYEYTKLELGMYFVLECHVNYEAEIKEGEPFRVESQILDHDQKRVHLFHTMYDDSDGKLVATNELMLIHVDFASRRTSPWPQWAMDRIKEMARLHAALERPAQVGSTIQIRRSE